MFFFIINLMSFGQLYRRITAEDVNNSNFRFGTTTFEGALERAKELGYTPRFLSQIIGSGEDGCLVLQRGVSELAIIASIDSKSAVEKDSKTFTILYSLYAIPSGSS